MTTEIKSRVECLSQNDIKDILSRNRANRKIRESHVRWLAAMMSAGKWRLNGESIKIASDGTLLDGQHRLHAAILAEVEFLETMVVRGLPPSTFNSLDHGKPRSIADGLPPSATHRNALAATLLWIHKHESSLMLDTGRLESWNVDAATSVLRRNPDSSRSVHWANCIQKRNVVAKMIPISALAFTHYNFMSHNAEKAAVFFARLVADEADGQNSATRAMRAWLMNSRRSGRATNAQEIIALLVKSWSAFVSGSTIKSLKWGRRGDNTESFPKFPGDDNSRGVAQKRGSLVKEIA